MEILENEKLDFIGIQDTYWNEGYVTISRRIGFKIWLNLMNLQLERIPWEYDRWRTDGKQSCPSILNPSYNFVLQYPISIATSQDCYGDEKNFRCVERTFTP